MAFEVCGEDLGGKPDRKPKLSAYCLARVPLAFWFPECSEWAKVLAMLSDQNDYKTRFGPRDGLAQVRLNGDLQTSSTRSN